MDATLEAWLEAGSEDLGRSRAALLQEVATSPEYRPKGISARLRLAVRDRRHPDDPRRATT